MVVLGLQLSARFDCIQSIEVPNDFEFMLSIQCTSCREVHSSQVGVNRNDTVAIPNSKGEANLVMKCKFCSQLMNLSKIQFIDVVTTSQPRLDERYDSVDFLDKTQVYLNEDAEQASFKTLASAECRNMEIKDWHLTDGFKVTCESGHVFDNVDLSEDFADYDETGNCPVEITEIRTKIVKVKS
ncbi:hypothetical protein MP228_001951 [Amoeboaphelidium protococcarum]|nr:hypothetical protein MP228_001951 [Amoeboaphelidium protococcarum]